MILGVIIAGGKSTRMGGFEKAFQQLDGAPLIGHVITRLAPQLDDIVINANGDAARFSEFGCVVVPDILKDVRSPLAGLHAGLTYAVQHGFSAVVSVPSDAPFVPADLVRRLQSRAAIASSAGQAHYLTGYWSCELLPILTESLMNNTLRRVQDWASLAQAIEVEWPVEPIDPFFNINTPEELAVASRYTTSAC